MRRIGAVAAVVILFTPVPSIADHAGPAFYLPWDEGVSHEVTCGNNDTSGLCTHNGADADAWDFGTGGVNWKVRAVRTGVIFKMRDNSNTGGCSSTYNDDANYVRILHPGSPQRESLYAHLALNSVTAQGLIQGQTVVRHSIIGTTDTTGYACGAHLHYQVQENCASPGVPGFCQSVPSTFHEGLPVKLDEPYSQNVYEFEPDPPWEPQGWEDFYARGEPASGDLTSGMDAASYGEGHVIAVARDANLQLVYRQRLSTQDWGPWLSLGAPTGLYLVGGPTAVSWNTGAACGSSQNKCHIDVFVRASDNNLWQKPYRNGWSAWVPLGSPEGGLTSDPDVSSWAVNRLDVFARGQEDHLYHIVWNGGWNAWENLCDLPYPACNLSSSPSAVSWGSNRIDVFVRGVAPQFHLYRRVWNGSQWVNFQNLCSSPYPNCSLTSAPDASSWLTNRLHVFVRGASNHLYQRAWSGSQWVNFENLCASPYPTCSLTEDPGAVSWGYGRIDVFGRDTANSMVQRRYGG